MVILVEGKPGSGKSALAQGLIEKLSRGAPIGYIATMVPYGPEGDMRVKRHLAMRAGKGYITFEKPERVQELSGEFSNRGIRNALLECISNLVGNEMHSPSNKGRTAAELAGSICCSVRLLAESLDNLVVVTNDFCQDDYDLPAEESGYDVYDEETLYYIKLTDLVNLLLREIADERYFCKCEK